MHARGCSKELSVLCQRAAGSTVHAHVCDDAALIDTMTVWTVILLCCLQAHGMRVQRCANVAATFGVHVMCMSFACCVRAQAPDRSRQIAGRSLP
jgi:hypothetical protein